MIEATQFHHAAKYADYLSTVAGRLRADLAWQNLQKFLPHPSAKRRVLDLGGGTGALSVRLAKNQFDVVLLDGSQEMLAIARKEAEADGVASSIEFHHGDASQLCQLFAPASFDFVVCHNVLEFVAEPTACILGISHVLPKDGACSLLFRNRAGEVLKAAIKGSGLEVANENLTADSAMDSLYGVPVRMFDPANVRQMLFDANLTPLAEYGVRIFSDYREPSEPGREAYRQIFDLELTLGSKPHFAAVARYTQIVTKHSISARASEGQK